MSWLQNLKKNVFDLVISLGSALRRKPGNQFVIYPDNCIRGLNAKHYVFGEGRIASDAFVFAERVDRTDDGLETSINWEDDAGAISFTLNQKKPPPNNDEIVYKVGVAVLPREAIDELNRSPSNRGMVSYERKPIPSNPYHGNIIIRNTKDKQIIKQIQGSLAFSSRFESQPTKTP